MFYNVYSIHYNTCRSMPELLDIWLTFGSERPRQAMLILGCER